MVIPFFRTYAHSDNSPFKVFVILCYDTHVYRYGTKEKSTNQEISIIKTLLQYVYTNRRVQEHFLKKYMRRALALLDSILYASQAYPPIFRVVVPRFVVHPCLHDQKGTKKISSIIEVIMSQTEARMTYDNNIRTLRQCLSQIDGTPDSMRRFQSRNNSF